MSVPNPMTLKKRDAMGQIFQADLLNNSGTF